MSFLLAAWLLENSTAGKFYFLIVQMVISIVNFFWYWFLSNKMINSILERYNSMLKISRTMNNAELQEKNHMQNCEKLENMFIKNNE